MELVLPDVGHKQAALEFREEHFNNGETLIHGDGGLDSAVSYELWLAKIRADRIREFSEEAVPATVYFGMLGARIIGITQIRHKLNRRLTETYGHIGYGVRPSERRKGYAAQMLALALEKCRPLGIDKVLVSCDKNNIGSAKTIIKNGGVFGGEVRDADGGAILQYWITL